jgi:hypothetical protein
MPAVDQYPFGNPLKPLPAAIVMVSGQRFPCSFFYVIFRLAQTLSI